VPSGSLEAGALGPIVLGSPRRRVRAILTRFRHEGANFDAYCLSGGPGIRVGYANARFVRSLPRRLRRSLAGRAVLAMTANPAYTLHGVSAGITLRTARRRLGGRLQGPYAVGPHRWFAQRDGSLLLLLKTEHGRVLEIGVAQLRVARTRGEQRNLLRDLGA
jgi:hypothetical protein